MGNIICGEEGSVVANNILGTKCSTNNSHSAAHSLHENYTVQSHMVETCFKASVSKYVVNPRQR